MRTSGLILLGTVHSDPLGYARALTFLSRTRPDVIFVELSPYALHFRKEQAPRLLAELSRNLRNAAHRTGFSFKEALRHSRIKAISRQLALPFEYRASEAYATHAAGAGVVAVDWSEFSRQWIDTWEELTSADNLESLLQQEVADIPVHTQYEQAARRISSESSPPDLWFGKDFSLWQSREEHIAANIRSEISRLNPRLPLYIGGWRHLMAGGTLGTVRDILGIGIDGCFLLDRGALSRAM